MIPGALRCGAVVTRVLRCNIDRGAIHHRRTLRESILPVNRIKHASQIVRRYSEPSLEAVLAAKISQKSANP